MTTPLIVPSTQSVIQLLETMKQSSKHICLVTDEFGGIVGLVTLNDVMEAIVGDFPSQSERLKPTARRREDGSWLVDAMIEIEAMESALPELRFGADEGKDYQTLAGFVVKQLGHVPKEGETFEWQGYVFEVLDMDRHRVDKVLLIAAAVGRPWRRRTRYLTHDAAMKHRQGGGPWVTTALPPDPRVYNNII